MNDRYILLLIALGIPAATLALENQDENITVTCYVDFDIFVSHEEKFCNGTKLITGNLLDGIYFQYRTNVTGSWVTLDVYNATKSIKEHVLEFQSNNTQFLWVQFRWIQFDTIGSPVWAIDDILIDCLGFFFRSISFEENPDDYNKNFICHSGFQQGGAQECTDTQYSLLLNGTNRELRMSNFNLLNDTFQKGDNIPNNCQPQNCFGPSLSHGFIWSTTQVNETARMQCSEISGVFWSGLYATRKCLDGGVWDEVDMSQCTIKDSNKMPFIVYSLYLEIPEFINSSYLTLNQLHQSLDVYNTSYSVKLHTKVNVYSVTIISFTITFNDDIPVQGNDTMMEVAKHLVTTESNYSSSGLDGFPEVVIMYPVDVCLCKNFFISEEELLRIIVINACVGIPIPPCTAYDSDSGSKCNEPHYTGNITHCAIANMRNETQHDCSEGYDMEFGIRWKGMRKNSTVSQRCPNGIGDTLRLCDSLGNWQVPDMQMCNSSAHHKLFEQICNMTASIIDISELNSFLTDLAERIHPNNFSVFPRDLKTVNSIIEKILIALEENSTLLRQEEINIAESLLNIYDSIFDSKNEPGFQQLMEIDRAENQKLIILSEKFGMLLATNTNAENDELAETLFVRENFVISVQRSSVRDISFRPQLNQYNQTSIHIPSQLLEQKSKDVNGVIPIVNIVYKTLHMFLPITINPNGQMKELVSIVVSSQVGNRDTPSLLPLDNPVTLKFDHNAPNAASNLTRCGFWNFTLNQTGGNGGWDSSNVMVAEESQNGKIICHSLHLTCFAVLVDVSVVSGPSDFSSVLKKQEMELSIVTYIGCGISVIFLLIAIAFLIMFRNTILQSVDNFIHLNLSIALFLALIVFLAGIEAATDNQAACTVVAALLHYLFTAVFSWMLCEGILLYFLIVKVLSFKFTKKKWPYFILGWGIPIPIVATAVGIAHHHYGNDNYCWISIEDVTIWAFVGPMLLIILVSAIVLIMVLLVLFKAKSQNISADEAKQVDIVKSLLKGAVVLLPLLGVTWVFGLLAVNEDLIVFAWIFTILNSLQGFLILLFYVLRNKKVREKVKSTVSLKIYGTSTPNSPPPTEGKTGTSVKINIERYEGNTMDGTKTIDDSNCYASTVKTSCSEGENDTSQMSLTYWQR